jgi:hypothetical protein
MLEHWALIDENPGKANLTKFLSGDYKSVGIDDTVYRLQNIAGVKITREAQKSFAHLRKHRNRLIHSFHPKYIKSLDHETIQGIVVEQTKAWFYLHRLLTKECSKQFSSL